MFFLRHKAHLCSVLISDKHGAVEADAPSTRAWPQISRFSSSDQNHFFPLLIEYPYVSTIDGGHVDHPITLQQCGFTKRLRWKSLVTFLKRKMALAYTSGAQKRDRSCHLSVKPRYPCIPCKAELPHPSFPVATLKCPNLSAITRFLGEMRRTMTQNRNLHSQKSSRMRNLSSSSKRMGSLSKQGVRQLEIHKSQ